MATGAMAEELYIVTDQAGTEMLNREIPVAEKIAKSMDGKSIIAIDQSYIGMVGHFMHNDLKRCGGFFGFQNKEEAYEFLNNESLENFGKGNIFADYAIDQQDTVNALIAQVDANNIESTIRSLSNFHTRYYKSQTGVDSQNWVKSHWESLAASRSDVKVEFFNHQSWQQPSVIMTIKGKSEETIVVGGHADSISGYFGGSSARAPGADDNASGISTITEVIRILLASGYVPEKTIKFMGYAAEEVGLLGSKEIAQDYNRRNEPVIGVLQLDMTNFNGSRSQDITLISDYTNEEQNKFLGKLVDEYVKLTWGYDRCGYACSDHASWTAQGFPASTPFESKKNDMNRRIHTANDTIEQSGGNAGHAAKFAKLALAFIVELDK